MSKGLGTIQQKVLILLLGGLALSFAKSPKQQFRIMRDIKKEWKGIERRSLVRAIKNLYESQLVVQRENKDGSMSVILTSEGRERALSFNLEKMQIQAPSKWDGKWRIVLFDIPENNKRKRDVFRCCLKRLNFYEFQKSVFIHPYCCKDEVDYLLEVYRIRKFVRFVLADSLDNELHIKKYFDLI
jgi:DNA-binding transcriptional regulator PaaX